MTRLWKSWLISPMLLLLFRLLCFLYGVVFVATHLAILGIAQLQFFPVWCLILFVIYFGVRTSSSTSLLEFPHACLHSWIAYFIIVFLHEGVNVHQWS